MSACGLLGVGADYAHISGAQYARLLFTLSKCMVSLSLEMYLLLKRLFNDAAQLPDYLYP